MRYLVLCLFILPTVCWGQAVSIGNYSIGHAPIEIDLSDFVIKNSHPDVNSFFVDDSLQWVRSEKNLLTPSALLRIEIKNDHFPIYIKYKNQLIIPIKQNEQTSSQFYVELFSPSLIQIFKDQTLIDEIRVSAKSLSTSSAKQWIDYSCLPFHVQLTGIETEYASVGCKLDRMGLFGHEKPRLEVTLSSTNLKTPLGHEPPFTFYFDESSELKTLFQNSNQKKVNTINLSAQLPESLPRIKIAGGFGPYSYTTSLQDASKGPQSTFSYMLYGKLSLSDSNSLKAFDALIYDKTFFNNSGLYYSFDLARLFDGRMTLGTLLGFQGLHYQYDDSHPTEFEIIYPQGFEFNYLHPFGLENHYLSFGMFLSTNKEIYKNIWLRYGEKIFYEINYIHWGKTTTQIEMWGLSVGFPLADFL